MTAAILAVIVTAVGGQTTGMGGGSDRPPDGDYRARKRDRHYRGDNDYLQASAQSADVREQNRALQRHLCLPQYLSQRAAQPPRSIAQETSPAVGDTHHAAVRLPPAEPVDTHRSVGPSTKTCPCGPTPLDRPSNRARASRDPVALAATQGCPGKHEPSISLAAMPESLIRGPSAHNIGPSPSHTAVGVQSKAAPAGTALPATNKSRSMAEF